jgi:hypothetical protein
LSSIIRNFYEERCEDDIQSRLYLVEVSFPNIHGKINYHKDPLHKKHELGFRNRNEPIEEEYEELIV